LIKLHVPEFICTTICAGLNIDNLVNSPPEIDSSFKQRQVKYKQVNLGNVVGYSEDVNESGEQMKGKTEDIMLQKDNTKKDHSLAFVKHKGAYECEYVLP